MISKNTNKNGVKLLATVAVMAMVFAAVGICIVSDSDAGTDDFSIRFSSNSNLNYEKIVEEDGNYTFKVGGFTVPATEGEVIVISETERPTFGSLYSGAQDIQNYTYMVLTGTGMAGLYLESVSNPALGVAYPSEFESGIKTFENEQCNEIVSLIPQGGNDDVVEYIFSKSATSTDATGSKVIVKVDFTGVTALAKDSYQVVTQTDGILQGVRKHLYIKEDVKVTTPVDLKGKNIYIAPGKTLTVEGTQDGNSEYSAISSAGDLEIIGGTLKIDVSGVCNPEVKGTETTFGINVGEKVLKIQNCELEVNVSSSIESNKNDIRAFAIEAMGGLTLDNVTGTVAGGNRAIQIGSEILTIENSEITLKGAEKAIQAKNGTVNINGSDVTLDLVDPMVGSNTGADDRFGLKVKVLNIDDKSTLTTDGLRVLDSADVSGILDVKYNSHGGREKDEVHPNTIPAGMVLYAEENGSSGGLKIITIIDNGKVMVEPGNAIVGIIEADKSSKEETSKCRATFGACQNGEVSAIVVTARTTFSVGSLDIEGVLGSYTADASTGKITVTGDIKISGEADVEIEVSDGKVTVPSGKTFILNNKMTMRTGSELQVVGEMVGTGKIEKASGATDIKINAVDPVAVQNMVGAGLTVTSDETAAEFEITGNEITEANAIAIESLFFSNTAVEFKGSSGTPATVVIQDGVTLTIPATGTLYLNGFNLKVGEGSTLNINGKVRMGTSDASKLTVEGNLILDGADVRVPVDVNDDKAYVSISNAKTMKVEGSATSELDVGFGNTLVLTDITIPSGRAVNVYGTVQVNGTVTVSKGAQFNVYLGGEAEIIGNLVVIGVANVTGEMDVDGTVKVTNDNGGAFFNVLTGGKVTVSEKATMTVSKSKNTVENKLDVSGELDIEGTLVVTGTLKGAVNDKGTLTLNGKSENATIRLFDGVTITVTSIVGTVTLTDAGTVGVKDYSGVVASYIGNKVIVSDAKNITVSAEIAESVKAQTGYTARYLVGTLTVSGVVTSVDESAAAYSSVTAENSKGKTDSQGRVADGIKDPSVMQRVIIGDITLGKNVKLDLNGQVVEVKGDVVAVAKNSLVETTESATVSGSITIGPECGKAGDQDKLNVNAVMYTIQDTEANETTYYTTFDKALDAVAYENSYEVLGKIKVKGELTILAGYKVVLATDAGLTIDSAGILTVADTALLDGAAGAISVDGKLSITDKDSGFRYNTGEKRFTYQVYTENGTVATYTGLLGALEAAEPGDIITLMQKASLTKDATVKDGVTLIIPRGISLEIGDKSADVELTVNGTLNIQGEVKRVATEHDVIIAVNGVIASTGTFVSTDFGLKDYVAFSEKVDGKLTDFYSNLTFASQTVTDGVVTVYGSVSAGDIKFQKAEKALGITVGFDGTGGAVNTISVSSMTLSGATLQTVKGKVTGTVVAEAAGSDAEIQLNGVTGVTITSMSEPGTLGNIDYLKIDGTNNGKVVVSKGTVTLGGSLVVGTNESSTFVVAEGATLDVVKTTSLTVATLDVPAGKTTYYGLTVDGTVTVNEGTLTVNGWALVNGAVVIEKSGDSKVNTKGSSAASTVKDPKIQINGTLDVKSTEDAPAKFTIAGTASVGSAPTLGANGVVSGPVQIGGSDAFLIVFAGADSASAEIIDYGTQSDSKASEIYVNGIHYMTVYVNSTSSVDFEDVKSLIYAEGYDSSSIEGFANGMPVGDASLANYDRIDCTISASYVDLIYSEGVGLVMYIDGLGVQNFHHEHNGYLIQIGTHTVSFAVMSGYDDSNVTVTVNGKAVGSDGKFQVTADLDEVIIIVSGATPASTPAPTPVTPADDGDDEMGLTEYLLIVLVVLAAILVVVVAIRMMRS